MKETKSLNYILSVRIRLSSLGGNAFSPLRLEREGVMDVMILGLRNDKKHQSVPYLDKFEHVRRVVQRTTEAENYSLEVISLQSLI
jgi:hypothetical protein